MLMCTYNPEFPSPRQENDQFKVSLSFIAKPCLGKKTIIIKFLKE